jgi:hypothetical protein
VPKRLPPKLKRGYRPYITPRIGITIFCEGRNTEPGYFRDFAAAFGNQLVRVRTEGGAGVPLTLVKKAKAELDRLAGRKRESYEEGDQVWIAFDCDEHPGVKETIRQAGEHNIGVAYSNPCFELWALLHLQDHDAPIGRHDLQKLLAKVLKGYDAKEKRLDFDRLRPGYESACQRAEAMRRRRRDEGSAEGNPFTSVDGLTGIIAANGKRR